MSVDLKLKIELVLLVPGKVLLHGIDGSTRNIRTIDYF